MAREWTTARLGDLCQLRAGTGFKHSLQGRTTGDIPFVKVSDMNLPANAVRLQDANNWISEEDLPELRAKPFPPGTVVFAKIGEALRRNRLRQVTRRTVVDNNLMGAVPRVDRVDARFFYYALSKFDFSEIAQGTALPYLTVASLSALTLPVPPIPDQRAIAGVLGALDDKIELNRRMSETLEEMARAQFTAVLAKHWDCSSMVALRDVLTVLETGRRPRGGVKGIESGVPSVGAESITRIGEFDFSKTKYIPVDYFETMKRGIVEDFDVLLYKDGGKPGVYEPHVSMFGLGFPFEQFCINEHVYRLRVTEPLTQSVLYYWLTSEHALEEMRTKGSGVAVPGLNSSAVRSLAFPTLSEEAVNEISSLGEAINTRILIGSRESRLLGVLRDSLLPKLISGELRVPDAERIVSEVG